MVIVLFVPGSVHVAAEVCAAVSIRVTHIVWVSHLLRLGSHSFVHISLGMRYLTNSCIAHD